jgi:Ran GTPase-activating protein (RanGAP) involved in mRNA processing and transport
LQNKLTHLTLRFDLQSNDVLFPRPSIDQINDLISHQANLMELDLSGCGINDETLAVIGSTCEHLK